MKKILTISLLLIGLLACNKEECPNPSIPQGYIPAIWAGYWSIHQAEEIVTAYGYTVDNKDAPWDIIVQFYADIGIDVSSYDMRDNSIYVEELYVRQVGEVLWVVHVSQGLVQGGEEDNWIYTE